MIRADSKDGIVEAVRTAFSVNGNITLQVPYEDDWLDVDEVSDLPDTGKLKFITVSVQPSATPRSENQTSVSHTTPILSGELQREILVSSPTTSAKGFGIYSLPNFPHDIQARLNSADVMILTRRHDRSRLIQVLYDDLMERVGV